MPKLSAEKVIEMLNSDLAAEIAAIIQYLQVSYRVLGLIREPISERLEDIAEEEMKHAKELANRIVALGGTPTVKPNPILQADTYVGMMEQGLKAEEKAIKDYVEHRNACEEGGEVPTALILENIIVDEQHHWDIFYKLIKETKTK